MNRQPPKPPPPRNQPPRPRRPPPSPRPPRRRSPRTSLPRTSSSRRAARTRRSRSSSWTPFSRPQRPSPCSKQVASRSVVSKIHLLLLLLYWFCVLNFMRQIMVCNITFIIAWSFIYLRLEVLLSLFRYFYFKSCSLFKCAKVMIFLKNQL